MEEASGYLTILRRCDNSVLKMLTQKHFVSAANSYMGKGGVCIPIHHYWEEPAGENPPDGAIIDYYLQSDAKMPSWRSAMKKAIS